MQYKNVLITGASSGLGKAIVDELESEDVVILILGRNKDKLALLKKPNVHVIYGDCRDELMKRDLLRPLQCRLPMT